MTVGFLVNPDLTRRKLEFELEHANQFLGGTTEDRVSVVFQEDGTTYAALYNPEAKAEGAEPNPVACPACSASEKNFRLTAALPHPAGYRCLRRDQRAGRLRG